MDKLWGPQDLGAHIYCEENILLMKQQKIPHGAILGYFKLLFKQMYVLKKKKTIQSLQA
jgi:hypothetical protein